MVDLVVWGPEATQWDVGPWSGWSPSARSSKHFQGFLLVAYCEEMRDKGSKVTNCTIIRASPKTVTCRSLQVSQDRRGKVAVGKTARASLNTFTCRRLQGSKGRGLTVTNCPEHCCMWAWGNQETIVCMRILIGYVYPRILGGWRT